MLEWEWGRQTASHIVKQSPCHFSDFRHELVKVCECNNRKKKKIQENQIRKKKKEKKRSHAISPFFLCSKYLDLIPWLLTDEREKAFLPLARESPLTSSNNNNNYPEVIYDKGVPYQISTKNIRRSLSSHYGPACLGKPQPSSASQLAHLLLPTRTSFIITSS